MVVWWWRHAVHSAVKGLMAPSGDVSGLLVVKRAGVWRIRPYSGL